MEISNSGVQQTILFAENCLVVVVGVEYLKYHNKQIVTTVYGVTDTFVIPYQNKKILDLVSFWLVILVVLVARLVGGELLIISIPQAQPFCL